MSCQLDSRPLFRMTWLRAAAHKDKVGQEQAWLARLRAFELTELTDASETAGNRTKTMSIEHQYSQLW